MDRKTWWALVAMLAAAVMDLIDTTIVNVAAPAVRADLGASAAQIEWTVAGYGLAFGTGLIIGARLGDSFGRRPAFLAGVAGFVLASLVDGLAPDPAVLVAGRAVQGLAAAVMIPQILTVIQVAIPATHRAKAFAGYGATAAIGSVSGPLLGGLIVSANLFGLGWRPIFLINVPIGIVAVVLGALTLPDSRAEHGRRLDVTGAIMLGIVLLLVLFPLVEGPQLHWPMWTVGLLVAAGPGFGGFVAHQRRRETPLVPLGLFGQRAFTGGVLAQVTLYAGVTGFFLVLAVTLQAGQGYSALRAGLTFVAWSLGIVVTSAVSGTLAPRLGRRLTVTGVLVTAAGMAALLIPVTSSAGPIGPWALVPGLLIAGLGMGAVAPTLVDVCLREIHAGGAGSASGIVATAGQLGVAGIGALYFSTLSTDPARRDYTAALTTGLWYQIATFVIAALVMLLIPKPGRRA